MIYLVERHFDSVTNAPKAKAPTTIAVPINPPTIMYHIQEQASMLTIDPTTLVVITALLSAGSALIGVLITSYFNLRTTRLTKESEERKHQKEIVINAALENWKQTAALWQRSGVSTRLQPLDAFLVHMVALSDVIFDPTTNTENLKSRLSEVRKMTDVAEENSKDPRQQIK